MPDLEASYSRVADLVPAAEFLLPKTGTSLGPSWVYIPRN